MCIVAALILSLDAHNEEHFTLIKAMAKKRSRNKHKTNKHIKNERSSLMLFARRYPVAYQVYVYYILCLHSAIISVIFIQIIIIICLVKQKLSYGLLFQLGLEFKKMFVAIIVTLLSFSSSIHLYDHSKNCSV